MTTFFRNPQTSQNLQKSTLLIKISSKWPEKKFSYILVKGLYKKFSISGRSDEIFINKVAISHGARVTATSISSDSHATKI